MHSFVPGSAVCWLSPLVLTRRPWAGRDDETPHVLSHLTGLLQATVSEPAQQPLSDDAVVMATPVDPAPLVVEGLPPAPDTAAPAPEGPAQGSAVAAAPAPIEAPSAAADCAAGSGSGGCARRAQAQMEADAVLVAALAGSTRRRSGSARAAKRAVVEESPLPEEDEEYWRQVGT